jgi:iron complex transport system substrate-binding protein
MAMRICSFLPSATEMIAELGFIDSLVGVSEECRWPPEVVGKPVVTAASIDPASMSSLEIDEAVRASVRDGRSLYMVDAELIAELAPDLIVTQDLCAVCAVSSGDLESACRRQRRRCAACGGGVCSSRSGSIRRSARGIGFRR